MRTTFISTKETEAQRLIQIAKSIVDRFWQVKAFYLLPQDVPDYSGREIYFPDLNYPASFWDEAQRLTKLEWIEMPLGTNPEILNRIAKIIPDAPPSVSALEKKWRRVEKPFWQFCRNVFPEIEFKNFEVWVTRYNRLASFTQDHAWVHFEADAGDIAEAVLSGSFRRRHLADSYTWEESEAVIDNLILNSKLRRLFPDWRPTLMRLRSNSKYAAQSAAYFQKLGYGHKIDLPAINKFLTETETQILKRLQDNAGSIVDFETLGDIIWKNEALEKYSEWAIAQAIHRLRQKIRSLGITPEIIQTKRGKGYYLLSL